MTALTGPAFVKGNEFAPYGRNASDSNTGPIGPIAVSSQHENENDTERPFEP